MKSPEFEKSSGDFFMKKNLKLFEIITLLYCFSMKMYSNRRKEKLNLIKKELELENSVNVE